MCTVSWNVHPEGYDLFFSRDEQRNRVVAQPPRKNIGEEVAWVAPYDPQGGGTWILANSHGLTVCILNAYTSDHSPTGNIPTTSRGTIPTALSDAGTIEACHQRLEQCVEEKRYAAFFLFCLSPSGQAANWLWNGNTLDRTSGFVHPPITTSSYESESVCRARLDAFQSITRDAPLSSLQLLHFHQCPGETACAETVRMSRPDACTVSLTHVTLQNKKLQMAYAEREGDAGFSRWQTLTIPRTTPVPSATEIST